MKRPTKRILLCAATLLCAVAATAAPAGAADECRGLQVCISVPGPWVVVPEQSGFDRTPALYLLACPGGRGVVGGTGFVGAWPSAVRLARESARRKAFFIRWERQ